MRPEPGKARHSLANRGVGVQPVGDCTLTNRLVRQISLQPLRDLPWVSVARLVPLGQAREVLAKVLGDLAVPAAAGAHDVRGGDADLEALALWQIALGVVTGLPYRVDTSRTSHEAAHSVGEVTLQPTEQMLIECLGLFLLDPMARSFDEVHFEVAAPIPG